MQRADHPKVTYATNKKKDSKLFFSVFRTCEVTTRETWNNSNLIGGREEALLFFVRRVESLS